MAYLRGIKIIIIYTPNNYLSKSECGLFMDYVDKLSSLGIAFFIFDHDTEYLMRNSDRIFVIEHGITTAVLLPNEYSFIHSYFFKDTERKLFKYPSFSPTLSSDTRSFSLSFNNVYTDIFKDISFEISSGEILSIVCPRYNDFIEFKKLLFSDMHPLAGSIYIYDKPFVAKDMTTAISQGMYLLDENATSTMVDENLSLLDNCYFEITHKAKIPFIPNGYYYSAIRTLETFFEPDQLLKCASSLTHFEKTKLVLCKIMLHTPKILVCMNPFAYGENKELDLIKKMLMRFANGKMSILILSLKSPTISDIDMCSFSISSHGTLVQL